MKILEDAMKSTGENQAKSSVKTEIEETDSSLLQFGAEEILAALPVSEQGPFNRSKLMLIGQGEAGKTATSRSILGLPHLKASENQSTVGVDELTCDLTFANVHSKGLWSKSDSENNDYETSIAQLLYEEEQRRKQPQHQQQHHQQHQQQQQQQQDHESSKGGENTSSTSEISKPKSNGIENVKEKNTLQSVDFDADMVNKCLAEKISVDSHLRISIFDFGGQKIFSAIHHLFLTKYGVYLIVFNMNWMVGSQEEKSRCLEYLEFWVNSVGIHTCDEKSISAPIAFVGTHADCVSNEDDYRVISKELKEKFSSGLVNIIEYDNFQGTSDSLFFFPVNNVEGKVDENLQRLLQHVEQEILKADYIQKKHPLSWLKCMDILKELSVQKPYLTMNEIESHCCSDVLIVDKNIELPKFLKFAHEMGAIMWHHQDEGLKDIVILDPAQFLIKPATFVICQYGNEGDKIRHRQEMRVKCEKKFPKAWSQMMKRGIVSSELLQLLLSDFKETRETIILLMIKYGLMMPIEMQSSSQQFLDENIHASYNSDMVVPALLPAGDVSSTTDLFQEPDKWSAKCYLLFQTSHAYDVELEMISLKEFETDGFLPHGVYEHLVSKTLRYVNRQVPHKHRYDGLFQDRMLCYLGSQLVCLCTRKDINSITIEVEGNNPPAIYYRVYDLIEEIIQEKMHSLKCTPLLQYDDDAFIHIDQIHKITEKGVPLQIGRNRIINKKTLQEKLPMWVRERNHETFHGFISYRWTCKVNPRGDDSSLVSVLFDQLSKMQSIGENDQSLSVFLDRIFLNDGDQFQEKFCGCLFNSRIILPIISSDALIRMSEGNFTSDQVDNVLIEWMLAMRVAKVKGAKIFPLLIGNVATTDTTANSASFRYLQKRESFFRCNLVNQLSTEIPKKSIETANKVMNDYNFPSSDIPEQSVKDIVSELIKYLGFDFCQVEPKYVVENYVEKVMEVLRKIEDDVMSKPRLNDEKVIGVLSKCDQEHEKNAISEGSATSNSDTVRTDVSTTNKIETYTAIEEKLAGETQIEMLNWFLKEGGFSLSTSKKYTTILTDVDIGTIPKLARKLKRNKNILLELGFTKEDAEDILEVLMT